MLDAQQPMFIAWGSELSFLYNDGYAHILGKKDRTALGRPFAEVWSDIWQQFRPIVDQTLSGRAAWHEDLLVPMHRNGFDEEAWFSFSYTPIRDEAGRTMGLFCAVTETTGKVLAELARLAERDLLSQMFEQAPGMMVMLRGPEHVFELANPSYRQLMGGRDLIGKTIREALPELTDQGFFDLLDDVFQTGRPFIGHAVPIRLQLTPDAPLEERYFDFVYQPVRDNEGAVSGIFVEGFDVTEGRIAVDAMRRSEETLKVALSAARLGTWERDLRTGEFTASPRCKANLGLSADEPLTFEQLQSMRHPDDLEWVTAAIKRAIEEGVDYDVEYRCLWPDGSLHWILARGHARYDEGGTPIKMVGVTLDITDRKQNEEALREESRALEILNGVAGQIAGELNLDDLVQTVVDAGVDLSGAQFGAFFYNKVDPEGEGYTLYTLSGAPREAFASYPLPRNTHIFAPTFRGEGVVRSDDITLDPRYGKNEPHMGMPAGHLPVRSYLAVPVRSRSGKILGGLFFGHGEPGVFANRAERLVVGLAAQAAIAVDNARLFTQATHLNRTLEQQVAERTADRDRMWRLSTDIMLVSRMDGTITAVNPAWTTLLGWTESDLIGKPFFAFVHSDDVASTYAEAARLEQGLATNRFENRYKHRDGSYLRISWTAVPEEGLIHAVGRDVTAERAAAETLRQTEEALRQVQKMETVGQLTGGVAHDFNNLLQIITGNLDIMSRNLPNDAPRLHRLVENAMTGAKRAATLTQRLLAFSRRQPLSPKPLELNKLVSGMSELFHRTLGETIEVETVLASGLWRVEADANQLENALLNLAVNSRDAMPEGGKLTIETSNAHIDRAYAELNAEVTPGQYVLVSVSDTGAGMDAETRERVFEPFFTTKEVGKGTGLGLSMVYGFVKQSGGHVKVYSEPGEGTSVAIYLPRLLGASAEDELPPKLSIPDGVGTETILVCEDEDQVRAYSVEALRDLGYQVIEAADGPAALRLLEHARVDLLFTDVVLPGGMTGAVLAKAAKLLRPDLKVLYTTGYARNAIVHHGRLDAGVELLTKPFAFSELAARVREILDA
jgi:PAS domain S-box-containing protein